MNLKTITLLPIGIAALLLSASCFAQSTPANILGVYWSPKKDAKLEIYQKGNQYFGKTIWTANTRKDENNPDKSLRQRSLLGIDLLTNFVFDDGVYKDGKVYDPDNGKTYSCKLTKEGNNLKVRGYIGLSVFGRTEIFERVK